MAGKMVVQKKASEYPFPQADSPARVLQVLDAVCTRPTDDVGLAERFGIDPRQGAYYATAAAYLGLLRNSGGLWRPTLRGAELNAMADENERHRIVGRLILAMPVFEQAAQHLAAHGRMAPETEIAAWIRAVDETVSQRTATRRAQTVQSWVNAVHENTPDLIAGMLAAPPEAGAAPVAAAKVA